MALTNKQQVFIEEYLRCWNGAEAARAAGYKYPRRSAYENLTNPDVRQSIHKRLSLKAMFADEVLMRLAEQARADISDFIRQGGAIDWEAVAKKGHLVKRIRHVKGQESSIELYNAQAALDKLARAHGLFVEKQEVGGEITLRVVYNGDGTDDQSSETAP